MNKINKQNGEYQMPQQGSSNQQGTQQDLRARLQPKGLRYNGANAVQQLSVQDVLGPQDPSNLLYPLWQTNGVLFPYTPTISSGSVAEYDPTPFTHSNYGYNAYIRSYPKDISITAEFTAQTNDEAMYLLAVLSFFRSVTKSYFGVNPYDKAGTPPPTLLFNYLGTYQFNNVPVVVKDFSYTYDPNVDYVPVSTAGAKNYSSQIGVNIAATQQSGYTWVPAHITVSVNLDTQYIPINLRNEFNLDDFRTGKLFNKGYI